MKPSVWHLPWDTIADPPHALLDILRGCNISCTACYNRIDAHIKPAKAVEKELDNIMALRKVQSVSIVGGEVTLHPELCEIISMVKSRGLCVELFTNGVLLDPPMLAQLAAAGTDMIFLHIDSGQIRSDIKNVHSSADLKDYANRKAALIASYGIDAGLAMTAYKGQSAEIVNAIETVLQSPFLNYLLVTIHRDLSEIESIRGDLKTGMRGKYKEGAAPIPDGITIRELSELLTEKFQFQPFACIGSNVDDKDLRWLSYLIASLHNQGILETAHNMKASLCERLFLAWTRFKTGRYPMYNRQNDTKSRMQIFLNAFTGGRIFANLRFLAKACLRDRRVSLKRLLFQCPAFVTKEGLVIHCKNCPDAVVKNGGLVPVCISDYIQASEGAP